MTTTTTLESVISTVHEQSASQYDQVVGVEVMRFASLEQMTIDGQSFGVLPSVPPAAGQSPAGFILGMAFQYRFVARTESARCPTDRTRT